MFKNKKITLNKIKHQLYLWGSSNKPKLFFFHGWLDSAVSFHFLAQHLSKHYQCIGLDFRGYGKSAHTTNPLGYFFYEYVADVKSLIDEFSPKKPVKIVGHSFGGAVSSIYTAACPERVSHFVNLEGFTFQANNPKKSPERLQKWLCEKSSPRFRTFKTYEAFARRLQKNNPRLSLDKALFLAKHLTKKTKGGYQMSADPLHKLSEPYLFDKEILYSFWNNIKAKCLLVSADLTEANLWMRAPDLVQALNERMDQFPKHSKRVVLKNCGHMMHHEQPEILAEEILKFLSI